MSPSAGFDLTTLVVIGTDCIGSCKSYYHTTMTAPETVMIRIHELILSTYTVSYCIWYMVFFHRTTQFYASQRSPSTQIPERVPSVHTVSYCIWHTLYVVVFFTNDHNLCKSTLSFISAIAPQLIVIDFIWLLNISLSMCRWTASCKWGIVV